MEPQTYCFTLKSVVGDDFLAAAWRFIGLNLERFEVNSGNASRRFFKFDASHCEFKPFGELKTGLAKHYGLGAYRISPRLKDFIGYVTEGGAVHEHVDPDLVGMRHVRVNVLLRSADGCVPMMEGVPLRVEEGDAWLNLASRCRHGTTAVKGPGHRSVISFGYQIEPERGDALLARHAEWRRGLDTSLRAA